ncbi:hypothetical protein DQM68_03985 [Leptospira mayottensis]|uniref:Uncharacterized protein n=1 Tax=Leptospira mayottensis TaxID=1137606 RepID=A0ABN5NVA5_9LEPT|nr:hypothetical protein DQM68_03985 [Leptospira mayottensis]AXR63756.1 hypothetical protein DQM28_05475 [Leptospira mayottensis]AZQ03590.1 hypothetical protein LEP1GSC190_17745 [Leptospira mayottensis 200901116]TGN09465.1 hypothetical protein EHR03_07850 [Leptospira mayottensis]
MHDAKIEFLSVLSSQILFKNWKFKKYNFGFIFRFRKFFLNSGFLFLSKSVLFFRKKLKFQELFQKWFLSLYRVF